MLPSSTPGRFGWTLGGEAEFVQQAESIVGGVDLHVQTVGEVTCRHLPLGKRLVRPRNLFCRKAHQLHYASGASNEHDVALRTGTSAESQFIFTVRVEPREDGVDCGFVRITQTPEHFTAEQLIKYGGVHWDVTQVDDEYRAFSQRPDMIQEAVLLGLSPIGYAEREWFVLRVSQVEMGFRHDIHLFYM